MFLFVFHFLKRNEDHLASFANFQRVFIVFSTHHLQKKTLKWRKNMQKFVQVKGAYLF